MLTIARTLTALFVVFAPFTSAFAASARPDNSGLIVWVFLGFCGLIVVAQLLPALMLLFGLVKGVAEGMGEPAGEKPSR